MILSFHVKAKLRWLGRDWGKVDETFKWRTPFNIPIPIPPFRDVIFNDRGVWIEVSN